MSTVTKITAGRTEKGVPTAEQIAEWDAKYKRTAIVRSKHLNAAGDGPEWCVVLRRPQRPEYKLLRSQTHNPAQVADAQEVCFRKVCVWPEGHEAVDALLDDFPGIPESCGQAMLELVGAAGSADAK